MKKEALILVGTTLATIPHLVLAQDTSWLDSVSGGLLTLFTVLVPILLSLALAVFIWGMVVFIAGSGSEKSREEGKRKMIWGVLALFVIVTVWGIVILIQEVTNISGTGVIVAPRAR